MKADDVKRLYDREYVASYEQTFPESIATADDARYELGLLRSMLTPGACRLDAACAPGVGRRPALLASGKRPMRRA